jgi:tRNA (cytidine/uridine-2'-O-)-methyltransferase
MRRTPGGTSFGSPADRLSGEKADAAHLPSSAGGWLDHQEKVSNRTTMFHIALLEPEIPPTTGNIIRLCVATGATLHIIGRTGFPLGERTVRRAAVDYWDEVALYRHATLEEFEVHHQVGRIFCFSARATVPYTRVSYRDDDCLLFGCESKGLPPSVVARYADRALGIPMPAGKVRSLNLANAVGIVLYEALRQIQAW